MNPSLATGAETQLLVEDCPQGKLAVLLGELVDPCDAIAKHGCFTSGEETVEVRNEVRLLRGHAQGMPESEPVSLTQFVPDEWTSQPL